MVDGRRAIQATIKNQRLRLAVLLFLLIHFILILCLTDAPAHLTAAAPVVDIGRAEAEASSNLMNLVLRRPYFNSILNKSPVHAAPTRPISKVCCWISSPSHLILTKFLVDTEQCHKNSSQTW